MTTFFIGDELECYSNYSISVFETTELAIAGVSRGNVAIPEGSGSFIAAPLTDSVTGSTTATNDVLWTHFRRRDVGFRDSTTIPAATWHDSQGVMKVREMRASARDTGKIQMLVNSAWVDVVPSFDVPFNSTFTWDFRIKIGVVGFIEVYRAGVLVNRWEGDTTPIGNIAEFRHYGTAHTRLHQLILADYSTINHTIRRRTPNAAGFHQEWTGTFQEVDDAPSATIGTDTIYASIPGVKSTFRGETLSATPAGQVIKAVAVAEFSRNDGTNQFPQNVRPILRVNGVDYEGPIDAPIGAGWKGGVAFWENNPATGAAWTNIIDVNSTEFGVVAKN